MFRILIERAFGLKILFEKRQFQLIWGEQGRFY